jgi:hypothetical protein
MTSKSFEKALRLFVQYRLRLKCYHYNCQTPVVILISMYVCMYLSIYLSIWVYL